MAKSDVKSQGCETEPKDGHRIVDENIVIELVLGPSSIRKFAEQRAVVIMLSREKRASTV